MIFLNNKRIQKSMRYMMWRTEKMKKEMYELIQKRRKRADNKDYGICSVCREDDPKIMKHGEDHHVDGKTNSIYTERVCPNCHLSITEEQNKLPPKIRSGKITKNKIILGMRSHCAILKRIIEKQSEFSEELEESK